MLTDSQQRHTRLQKLSGSNFDLDPNQPDIRNWPVRGSMGTVGTVEDLIFDEQSGKVRYIVVDLKSNSIGLTHRQVLVPIGIAVIDKDDDDVLLPGITLSQLTVLQEYDADRFDTTSEESIRNVFGGLGAAALQGGQAEDVQTVDDSETIIPGLTGSILNTTATGGMMTDDTNGGQREALLGGPEHFYNHQIYDDKDIYRNRTAKPVGGTGTVSLNDETLVVENTPEYHTGIRLRERRDQ